MKKIPVLILFLFSLTTSLIAQECNDGIDNDGDGLVDWQYDLACTDSTDATEAGTSGTIENGWTNYEPAGGTQIYYVSSSDGNDENDGLSPENPLATYAAAFAKTSDNTNDWILLKRGDIFYENVDIRYGNSKDEPFLISTYGESTVRPLMKTGAENAIDQNDFQYFTIIGLDFYAHTRNPDSDEFVSYDGSSSVSLFRRTNYPGNGVLIENCAFRYYGGAAIQGQERPSDISIRRNIIEYSYATGSHSSGFYFKGTDDVVFDENIMDHNGWLVQSYDDGQAGGQATKFNHNTYFNGLHNMSYSGNILLRGASMGSKFTAEFEGSAQDYVISNNLYVDNEVGIGIGDNYDVPYRFNNVSVTNNVMLDMGKSMQTNRVLGWGARFDGLDDARIENNYFLHSPDEAVYNSFAFELTRTTRDVAFNENVIHGLFTSDSRALILLTDNSDKENISFTNNRWSAEDYGSILIESDETSLSNFTFTGNEYRSSRTSDEWFDLGSTDYSFAGWVNHTNEVNGADDPLQFCDTSRNISSYQTSIGQVASNDAFFAEVKKQGKHHWRTEYDVNVINDWIRAGYADCSGVTTEDDQPQRSSFGFDVYPNPATSFINVNNNLSDQLSVVIYDIAGRRIDQFTLNQGQEKQISLKNLANGLYLIQLDDGESIQTQKIIKN